MTWHEHLTVGFGLRFAATVIWSTSAASPRRSALIFDLNDFDETAPGPWEWDVKRLVASFTIAGRQLGHGNLAADEFAFLVAQSYQRHMREYADMSVLDLWYERITFERMVAAVQSDDARRRIRRGIERASRRTHETMLPKLADQTGNTWRIRDAPPAVFHIRGKSTLIDPGDEWMTLKSDRQSMFDDLMRSYVATLTPERGLAFAIRVSGCRIQGDRRGKRGHALSRHVADRSSGQAAFPAIEGSIDVRGCAIHVRRKRPCARWPAGHSRTASDAGCPDPFLGWATGPVGRTLYICQLRDMKISAEFETYDGDAFREYAQLCGWALARAHAKAGGRAPEISGYIGSALRRSCAMHAAPTPTRSTRTTRRFGRLAAAGRLEACTDADMVADFAP